jgi:ABC-type glycerol-3-phosphate transport system substrate-binding protein
MMRHRALAGALATLLALSACGDDDDGDQAANSTTTAETTTTSTAEALCAAIDDVEQDIGALADIDVLAEGTDAIEARLTTIRQDLAEIRDLAPDIAPEEAAAFDSALRSLGDAITTLGDGSLTAESAQDVVSAGASTVEAGQAYLGSLDDACP